MFQNVSKANITFPAHIPSTIQTALADNLYKLDLTQGDFQTLFGNIGDLVGTNFHVIVDTTNSRVLMYSDEVAKYFFGDLFLSKLQAQGYDVCFHSTTATGDVALANNLVLIDQQSQIYAYCNSLFVCLTTYTTPTIVYVGYSQAQALGRFISTT